MIFAHPTKYGTGIVIFGDYNDFRALHSFIYEASENDIIPYEFQEYLLGFAYEVRKAYEGAREKKDCSQPMPHFEFEKNLMYVGFKYNWIDQLLTVRLLRWAAAFRPTFLHHQAMIFMLESITHSALVEYDAKQAEKIWEITKTLDIFDESYAMQWIPEVVSEFFSLPNGKKRFTGLYNSLRDLMPLSENYREFYEELKLAADRQNCDTESLLNKDNNDLDFKW